LIGHIILLKQLNLESIVKMDTKNIITTFVAEKFMKGKKSLALTDDSSFIESGIIDSLGVLELTAFIEETFSFRVEDDELVPDNLDSINRIVDFITLKLAGIQAQPTVKD
jgi:acyl carrier protein